MPVAEGVIKVPPLVEHLSARIDHHFSQFVPKRGNTMIKAGDMFKNIDSGKIFTVTSIDPSLVILGTKDGFHSIFVKPNNMESAFVPFVEEEANTKPK